MQRRNTILYFVCKDMRNDVKAIFVTYFKIFRYAIIIVIVEIEILSF